MTIDIDATLDAVVSIKRQIKELESELDALDTLRTAVDDGNLDPQFEHNDAKFNLQAGRTTYTYPPDVKAIADNLKRAQSDSVANGTAIAKQGNPFWTINLP